MRYFKSPGEGIVGPFYGMEEDSGKRWVWEDGCFQIFPSPTISPMKLEYIRPFEFFCFVKKHSELMINELVDSEVRQNDS